MTKMAAIWLISIPDLWPKRLKTIPFARAAHTYIAHIREYPPPPAHEVLIEFAKLSWNYSLATFCVIVGQLCSHVKVRLCGSTWRGSQRCGRKNDPLLLQVVGPLRDPFNEVGQQLGLGLITLSCKTQLIIETYICYSYSTCTCTCRLWLRVMICFAKTFLTKFNSVLQYPMTAYIVAGTQATPGKRNHVIVMKMSQLDKTLQNDEESELNDQL